MVRKVHVVVKCWRGASKEEWITLSAAAGMINVHVSDDPSTTALFEVEVNGATAAWCVEKAVWIMTAAIGRVPSLRDDAHVSEIPMVLS